MSGRWKMNRIGFVNFWLYDEEIIDLTDGKLLLRGQNGSGKSITTQSFIPFILDGDRTPSRLDPFGSSDRRMEYYFLGEEGKEEATGYLFLEFIKEDTGEYRTIGIGQRARRGKAMDFWGFVLLDGRRIGYDLWLYKETGSTRLPYSKQELRKIVGEDTPFTDVPGEYKAMVNKYIFGFRRPEQYEQFIRLLVKVRAPKLSKEFKPTKVYEILNESLQTLTDEDLRAMVDAMEKMDGIQESLDQLSRAFGDVKIIRNEYIRYNQFMLARKAQAYLARKQEVDAGRQRLEAREKECRDMKEEIAGKKKAAEEDQARLSLADSELVSLYDTDMEEADRKLDKARADKADAEEQRGRWEEKITLCHERIRESEDKQKRLRTDIEMDQDQLREARQELDDIQETLGWDKHREAVRILESCGEEALDTVSSGLRQYERAITEGKQLIDRLQQLQEEYDQSAELLDTVRQQKEAKEKEEEELQEEILNCQDELITAFYGMRENQEWKPAAETLRQAEQRIREYERSSDENEIQRIVRGDWEKCRETLLDRQKEKIGEQNRLEEETAAVRAEIELLRQKEEIEPQREEAAARFRRELSEAQIAHVPFFKAVEFADGLSEGECARLEAQLLQAGILDALVVEESDFVKIKESFPQMLDGMIHVRRQGNSGFCKLKVSEDLPGRLQKEVLRILSNIYESDGEGTLYLGGDGYFRQGVLFGRADKPGGAEFVGCLARMRKKEQMLRSLESRLEQLEESLGIIGNEIETLRQRVRRLEEEYRALPGFGGLNRRLEALKDCQMALEHLEKQYFDQEKRTDLCAKRKSEGYQKMLQHCKGLPFGRTSAEYREGLEAAEEYQRVWQQVPGVVQRMQRKRDELLREKDAAEENEARADEAFTEKRRYTGRIQELEIEIRKYDEYLNRPENIEKAGRRQSLKEEIRKLEERIRVLDKSITVLQTKRDNILSQEAEEKEALREKIVEETGLRNYFEEELALKLVLEPGGRSLETCAREAVGMLRESDRGREPEDLLNSLYRVYQQHNSNLSSYGTSIEDCFGETEKGLRATRKRVRLVSVWNGKKLYLEEFYHTLKSAIEETELLIQEKDRELFEDILSQTISQQLTDRIAESRKWVQDMSGLMKDMDTSMGLSFSLDWRPKSAENEEELDTLELEHILLRDRKLLTPEDIERVASHFRSKIKTEKRRLEEEGGVVNYMDLVRDALDYRKWFTFQMSFYRNQEGKKPLTNAAFNRFSGGEKAMAMYVPLFAAVNAQYQKAENRDHPRMIALDEAFAGVDDKNISSMFELVEKLEFDYIMNSQALWGCYETVKGLKIAELLRPQNS